MFDRIYIIGMMGSGKSTVGKRLAQRFAYRHIDSDQEIKNATGMSISEIFERYGESYFRDLEHNTLKNLSTINECVISTGGGCIEREATRQLISETGVVIYLEASAGILYARLRYDKNRPLLQGSDLLEKIETLLERRKSWYESCADITQCSRNYPIRVLVDQLVQRLSDY